MTRPAGRLAIFDCDGTLVDSQANICRAMEDVFVAARIEPPTRAQIRGAIGLSLFEVMRVLLPDADDADHHRFVQAYRDRFVAMRASGALDQEPLYEGIAPLVARLADDGWLLGVATGKSDRGLAHVLSAHGLARHFVTLQTADRHPSKPHPSMIEAAIAEARADPAQTAMIGDTSYDMLMARNAGVRAIGVGWGYHTPDTLVSAGAAAVALEVAELAQHLDRR